jgi:hypothetical protein
MPIDHMTAPLNRFELTNRSGPFGYQWLGWQGSRLAALNSPFDLAFSMKQAHHN